jgi:hypothetical protein
MREILMTKAGKEEAKLHRDPITGTPGAHPLGTGAGAASGALAGAAAGAAVAGPPGALVGGAIGAVAGGLIGKGAAESVNPTVEEAFWKTAYVEEPYYVEGKAYEYYAPAYRIGWEGRARFPGRQFDDVEAELRKDYDRFVSDGAPDWQIGRQAARSAWNRGDFTSTNPEIKRPPSS